jgi:GntR family transcriptional regulator
MKVAERDEHMAAPRYRQVADDLRHAILTGVYAEKLPTEPELMAVYEVSRNTIRQALKEIAADGLIETRGRAGTYVKNLVAFELYAQADRPDRKGPADNWHAQVVKSGLEPSQDFEMRIVPAPAWVAKWLNLPSESLVCVRDCHRFINGEPWCEEIGYYPMDLAEECGLLEPHDIKEGCIRRLASRGYPEVGYQDSIWVRTATPEEKSSFNVSGAVPILIYDRVGWTAKRPIRLIRQVMPGDRNRLRFDLGQLPQDALHPNGADQ